MVDIKYSSTQVNFSSEVSGIVRDLENKLSPNHIHPTEKQDDDVHITVLYGLHDDDPQGVRELVEGVGSVQASITGVDIFRPDDKDYDVLVMTVDSPELCALHEGLARLPHTDTHPVYHPHSTIAYLVRGAGDEYKTMVTGLEGKVMTFDTLMFSDKDKGKTAIPLVRSWPPPENDYQEMKKKIEDYFKNTPQEKIIKDLEDCGMVMKKYYVIMKSDTVGVKGFVRTRKGKIERVQPFQRKGGEHKERYGTLVRLLDFVGKKIQGWKQDKKGFKFTPEQRKYVQRRLKEIQQRSEHTWMTKPQKQYIHRRMAEMKKDVGIKPLLIASKIGLSDEEYDGLRMMGYDDKHIKKMGKENSKAAYWNRISPEDAKFGISAPGSFLDVRKLPKIGEKVWVLAGFDPKPIQGTVERVSDIDSKGIGNTYVDVNAGARNVHIHVNQVFDHKPEKIEVKDEYGTTKVWR